jgi:hypothetical protein
MRDSLVLMELTPGRSNGYFFHYLGVDWHATALDGFFGRFSNCLPPPSSSREVLALELVPSVQLWEWAHSLSTLAQFVSI